MRTLTLLLLLAPAAAPDREQQQQQSGGGALLRRHSRLSDEYKQWLGSTGYLAGVAGVVPTPDGRTVAQGDIAEGADLVVVPQHLVLSWRTIAPRLDPSSALGRAIFAEPKLFPARLVLPIWLCYERHRPDSLWRPYLLSLPSKHDLPIGWRQSELARLDNSSSLGAATAADSAALRADHETSMARLCALYPAGADGGGSSGGFSDKVCALSTWLWAWSIIWSRGVRIDLPDTLSSGSGGGSTLRATALVPFADMINHAGPKHANARASWDSARGAWVVTSSAPIQAGAEVLVTYATSDHSDGKAATTAISGGKSGGSGNAWLLRRYGFVQPRASNTDSAIIKLRLGSSAPAAAGGAEASAVEKMARRALNRALFDAVEDSYELELRHPETAAGRASLRKLLLHAAVRVVDDPASRLDTFATGADIAERLLAELEPQEQEQQQKQPGAEAVTPLKVEALKHALMLVEGWLEPYSRLLLPAPRAGAAATPSAASSEGSTVVEAGADAAVSPPPGPGGAGAAAGEGGGLREIVLRGRERFCDPAGPMRNVRSLLASA